MIKLKPQGGFTVIELAIVMSIVGILMPVIVGIVAAQARIPVKIQSELAGQRQVQKATLLITEDAAVAQSFAPGVLPEYGTFSWSEFSEAAPVPVTARYYWENQELLRVLTRGGEVSPPQVVIAPVATSSDVTFQYTAPSWAYDNAGRTWSYTEGKITVSLTTTHEAGSTFADTVVSATLVSDFRPQKDRPVPIPGRLVPPAPPANQADFRIAGNPNLLTGSYRSGSGSDLSFDDANYYVARGAGTPRTVVWEATSENIDYTTTTSISVEFIGQVDSSGVSQEFFIYNPSDPEHTNGGYSPTPDEASPYSVVNTDKKVVFSFTEADVNYVNSLNPKVVRIKLKATYTSPFDISADQLIFKVAGTPATTFVRDYVLEANPTIETGSYVSGAFTDMSTNDTAYYTVNRTGSTVRWSAVSQPISLDTMSSVEVIFVGRVNQANTVQKVFVFNPANGGDGYSATPNATTTYASINTDVTTSFFLSSPDVDYAESLFPKEVRIRVQATNATGNWNLEADQLLFRVKP